jgi:hypothetical protein
MSNENTKFYERNAIAAVINPASQAAGTVSSGWISMAAYHQLCAVGLVGAFGASATVDAKLQQAQDSSGAGAKDITGKAITQMLAAGGNNKQFTIEVRDTELDANNGFGYVQFSMTVGTAATLVGGAVFGTLPQFMPGSAFDASSVVQHV